MLVQSKMQGVSAKRGSAMVAVPVRAVPGGALRSSRSSRAAVQVRAEVLTTTVDVVAINRKLEARAKALIALEEQEASLRPRVKFSLQRKVGLGEAWKIVGDVPELGRMIPEVAPYMKWNSGDVWTFEAPLRPGSIKYKAVLRRADGAYIWETGADRLLVVDDATTSAPMGEVALPA